MGRLAVIVVALALCTPRPAAAEERSTPRSTEWYGLEILAADFTSMMSAAVVSQVWSKEVTAGVYLAGYGFGPAGVHIAHGNWGRAALSVGIRAALPTVGGVLGYHSGERQSAEDDGGVAAFEYGALAAAVAVTLDAAFLAWTSTTPPPPPRPRPVITPVVSASADHVLLGVGGTL
jgi:hypothetical protein